MDITTFVLFGVVAVGLVYTITVYNSLVTLKHNVDKAWSNIDVLLKQRHDELPKLVETCKQYMRFEQETLEKVMQARSAVSTARERADVNALGDAVTHWTGITVCPRRGLSGSEGQPELPALTVTHLRVGRCHCRST